MRHGWGQRADTRRWARSETLSRGPVGRRRSLGSRMPGVGGEATGGPLKWGQELPGAAFFPFNFLPRSSVATGSTRPGEERLCQPPGHLSQKPNYWLSMGSQLADGESSGRRHCSTSEGLRRKRVVFLPRSGAQHLASLPSCAHGVLPWAEEVVMGPRETRPPLHPHCHHPVHPLSPLPGPWLSLPALSTQHTGTCSNPFPAQNSPVASRGLRVKLHLLGLGFLLPLCPLLTPSSHTGILEALHTKALLVPPEEGPLHVLFHLLAVLSPVHSPPPDLCPRVSAHMSPPQRSPP